ncbi:MAG: Zn-ribbon domain-containing OB-fold protein [Thermoplasmata archaeon]|nr:Zn-ribbon domain-containing OB-fold protein [Thermoplasmata archaeon]
MPAPRKFTKFREVQAEIDKNGAALFVDKEGVESLIIHSPYTIHYIHSYAEDSAFFLGLASGVLRGSKCSKASCGFVYGTPRGHCMVCGSPTTWIELPKEGRIHSWTTCHFGGEAFLKETPYNLAMVEFDGVGSLLLVRLKECTESEIYIGMPVEARFEPKPKYSITDIWFVPKPAAASEKPRRG